MTGARPTADHTVAPASRWRVWAPGRVNLIGEHTDYTGGLALPMGIQLGVTLDVEFGDHLAEARGPSNRRVVALDTDLEALGPARFGVPCTQPRAVEPPWARYPAGVAARLGLTAGLRGRFMSDLPPGSGLSSSAAVEIASAMAFALADLAEPAVPGIGPGTPPWLEADADAARIVDPLAVAQICQAAEHDATGVPCGIMDQLASAAAQPEAATLIDCRATSVTTVPLPDGLDIVVVDSGTRRALVDGRYAERVASCRAAEDMLGPLRDATMADTTRLHDPMLAARARHVVSENLRVSETVAALLAHDIATVGSLLNASHRSLADDFGVSTPVLDELVEHLRRTPGCRGARLTGAGFGGCVVAAGDAGWSPSPAAAPRWWRVRPVGGPTAERLAGGSPTVRY